MDGVFQTYKQELNVSLALFFGGQTAKERV